MDSSDDEVFWGPITLKERKWHLTRSGYVPSSTRRQTCAVFPVETVKFFQSEAQDYPEVAVNDSVNSLVEDVSVIEISSSSGDESLVHQDVDVNTAGDRVISISSEDDAVPQTIDDKYGGSTLQASTSVLTEEVYHHSYEDLHASAERNDGYHRHDDSYENKQLSDLKGEVIQDDSYESYNPNESEHLHNDCVEEVDKHNQYDSSSNKQDEQLADSQNESVCNHSYKCRKPIPLIYVSSEEDVVSHTKDDERVGTTSMLAEKVVDHYQYEYLQKVSTEQNNEYHCYDDSYENSQLSDFQKEDDYDSYETYQSNHHEPQHEERFQNKENKPKQKKKTDKYDYITSSITSYIHQKPNTMPPPVAKPKKILKSAEKPKSPQQLVMKNIKYNYIVSPVATYIKTAPQPQLYQKVTPNPYKSHIPIPQANSNQDYDMDQSFPRRVYTPARDKVLTEKTTNLPTSVKKLFPQDIKVIKHVDRQVADHGDASNLLEASTIDGVSILESKTAFIE